MKAISGSLEGIMEASCLQPIDVIKTRLQLDRSGNYKGILHYGTTISQTEGEGHSSLINPQLTRVDSVGWINGTEEKVVKIRLQQRKGLSPELFKYKGLVHCARMIIREEGFRGLWAGVAPTVMRNGTNQSVMFTAKNAFDVLLWKKHEGDEKSSNHGNL
ncbi:hypothetical protein VNO80_06373 [Phaseolus coccineus]|uniref:Uncharacterized protein n=1 Tax=Phaseolus coccineus TaxID=3886 RepID=A0AAN9REG1_PHACN